MSSLPLVDGHSPVLRKPVQSVESRYMKNSSALGALVTC